MPLTGVGSAPDIGLLGGGGADGTGYDFRRLPYNSHVRVRAGYATAARTYRAEFTGEFRGIVPPAIVTLQMRASGIDVLRFYGFGNETTDTGSSDFYKVKQQQYLIAPGLRFAFSPAADFSVGPVYKFAHTRLEAGTFINGSQPYGVTNIGQVGAAADFHVDTRDQPRAASRGATFGLGGQDFPPAPDPSSPLRVGHAAARPYPTRPVPPRAPPIPCPWPRRTASRAHGCTCGRGSRTRHDARVEGRGPDAGAPEPHGGGTAPAGPARRPGGAVLPAGHLLRFRRLGAAPARR